MMDPQYLLFSRFRDVYKSSVITYANIIEIPQNIEPQEHLGMFDICHISDTFN